jgi:flagellar protein FlgJ
MSVVSVHSSTAATPALTADQKTALAHLHTAANQFEGVFVGMVLKEMRASVSKDSLFGNSNASEMFNSMLDDQRAQSMAETGSLGIGKMVESQLKATVLANAAHESKVGVPTGGI